jgi:DNA-binding LacI/PurR family transcriptional regulator
VDGIIASIPSDDVYHSIKKAVQANIPVIVFNSGLKYAESLGLTRILQNDEHAGSIMGEELKKRNCSKPLLVKMSSLEKATSEERILGLSHILGDPLSFIEIKETDNLASQINAVKNAVLASKESFDSIISLGGSVTIRFKYINYVSFFFLLIYILHFNRHLQMLLLALFWI